ncbi:MAG TPA: TRAP transporter small permease [Pseudolabrys sp.]|nr:TRAP transporter small permease [Pseudolabrys sp.]
MVSRILDRLTGWIERALAYAFIAAVAINFINVVGRYGFGTTLLSADELQIFIMVFMTFLGAAVVAWRNQHLRMDVLVNALPSLVRRLIKIAELAVIVILAAFVLWNSIYYAKQMFNIGRVSDMAQVPMWIPHGVVAAGFGLMALIACLRLVEILARREPGGGKSGTEA